MSAKQDRQGVRTASQLEQKYRIGESFAKAFGLVEEAKRTAEEAQKTATEGMTPDAIFNALTNNGQNQGLYRGEDGELYINASYIKTGELIADLIKSGVLQSGDGRTKFDLDNGSIVCTSQFGKVVRVHSGSQQFITKDGQLVMSLTHYSDGAFAGITFYNPNTGEQIGQIYGKDDDLVIDCGPIYSRKKVLFSGNATVGDTFTVTNSPAYDLFAVKLGTADSTEDTVVLAYKSDATAARGSINGVGGWAGTASLAKELFFLSVTYLMDQWTLVDARKQGIYNAGSITTGTALNVKEIIGVI